MKMDFNRACGIAINSEFLTAVRWAVLLFPFLLYGVGFDSHVEPDIGFILVALLATVALFFEVFVGFSRWACENSVRLGVIVCRVLVRLADPLGAVELSLIAIRRLRTLLPTPPLPGHLPNISLSPRLLPVPRAFAR